MQTVQKRKSSVGSWCQNICSSTKDFDQKELLLVALPEPHSRNSSLGISLTIKSKSNRSQKMKVIQAEMQSMSSLKPTKSPLHKGERRVYLRLSKEASTKFSFDYQPRKGELSAEMTTFIKEDSSRASPRIRLQSSPRASQGSINRGLRQSSSILQNRLSNSKQESSQGSVLLIRNDEDDERSDQLRIKNLFLSRGLGSNRMSLTNVLNSITEQAQAYEGLGVNTPQADNSMMPFTNKKYSEQPFTHPFAREDFNTKLIRHNKTISGTNTSTACTTNAAARTRHNSFGSVRACRSRAENKPLRL